MLMELIVWYLISTRYASQRAPTICCIKSCSTPSNFQKTRRSSVWVSHIKVVIATVVLSGMVSGTSDSGAHMEFGR